MNACAASGSSASVGHRRLGLDQDRLVGDDVLELLARGDRAERLVLIREEDVALAADERLQRVARAGVLNRGVLEDLAHELERLLLRLALGDLAAVGGHQVPARAAGGERVRRDHLDLAGDQVLPGIDVLGIARAGRR